MTANVSFWYGRPITELTREELIEALEEMGRAYTAALQTHIADLKFLGELEPRRR